MRWLFLAASVLATSVSCGAALADSVVATRTIRAMSIIGPQDVTLVEADIPGALSRAEDAHGLEARVAIYAGRPVRVADLSAPAIVQRNQPVSLEYRAGALVILAEGRSLARGAVGDEILVMNLSSRTTVSGRVGSDGRVRVGP